MKYWEINKQGLNLIDMFETGWNKLQSFKYIEGKAVCVLGSYGNKISYYLLKYKELIQNPNLILRENPNMENIFEVKETDDSSFLDSKLGDKIMNGSEININKKNNNKALDENKYRIEQNINYEEYNNIGISKIINNNEINNIDISNTNKCLKEINDKEQKSINCIEFNTETKFAFGGKDKIIRYYNIDKFEDRKSVV